MKLGGRGPSGGCKGSAGRSGHVGSMSQGQLCEFQRGQVLDPVLGLQQPHTELQAGSRVTGKLAVGKGPWDPG